VAEQLRLEQRIGQTSAIDRDEVAETPATGLMNQARDHFLADTSLSDDENFCVRAGSGVDVDAQLVHFLALPEQEWKVGNTAI
jgi:hypothetical protein